MLDTGRLPWAVTPPAPLPLLRVLRGKTAEDAAALLPRMFNLCRGSQSLAARLAMGLTANTALPEELIEDIRRDHLFKLCRAWPGQLGLPVLNLDEAALFDGLMPLTAADWADFLRSHRGAAPMLAEIGRRFAGQATTDPLPGPSPATALRKIALENSVAGRHADHPALRAIEAAEGRSIRWRATARLVELTRLRHLPAATLTNGVATVPSSRGTYALRVTLEKGRVTALTRTTPTDHLLAPNGILDQCLAALPAEAAPLLPLLMDILDPCLPVNVEARDA